MSKITIELKEWDYTCGDGCCYEYGRKVLLNGEELEHPDSTEENWIPNSNVGDSVGDSLRAVLKKLGYSVEIYYTQENK